jgi:hypothetical protein
LPWVATHCGIGLSEQFSELRNLRPVATSCARDEIEVEAELSAIVSVSRSSTGPGLSSSRGHRCEHCESGRGLQIVGRLAEWSERIVAGRQEVSAKLPLPDAPARDTARVRL